MWIVRLALRRPFTTAVLAIGLMLLGMLSLARMRVDILPAIDIPVVIVVWNYPGLSAEDVERRITYLTERAMSTSVSGVARIESQSIVGVSIVKIYFDQGTDIGGAIAQVSASSQTVLRGMPPGIQPPNILRFNASNVPVAQLTLSSNNLGEQEIFDYGLNFIRLRLFTVQGLSSPAPFGGRQRVVNVDIDPNAAAAKGLSPQDVVQALLTANPILPAGQARIADTQYTIGLNSSPPTVAEFARIPVRVINGVTVYLGDVAHVRDGFAVQDNLVRVNGRRASYLSILKLSGASTLAVVDAARELIPSLKAAAPQGLELKIDFDQSLFVRAAIEGVLREGAISAVLVSLMIMFFLGSWRSMVIVSTSIPLAICAALGGLYLTGQSIDIMTLGGLSLAIGMLVDDATVEVENIHRNRLLGKPLTVAILDGAQQIATPALAATLTICIVFFPVVLLTGPARFLFTPLAESVVIAMLASYLLSRTLVPTLARMLMEKEDLSGHSGHGDATGADRARPRTPSGRFNAWRDRHFDRFRDGYSRTLSVVLAHRAFALLAFAAIIGISFSLPAVIGQDFFPSVDSGQMRLHVRAPAGTRIEETEEIVEHVEQYIRRTIPAAEIDTINDMIGVPIFYNLAFVQTDNIGGEDAEVLVALAHGHHPTAGYVRQLRAELAERFPGTTFYFQAPDLVTQVLNFGVSAPIDVQVESRDYNRAYDIARRLEERIRHIPGAVDIRIAQVVNHPSYRVDVDRERAAQVGLTERDVANGLLTTLSSSSLVAPSFWLNPVNAVNYTVVVQTPPIQIRSLADLNSTPITPGTSPVLTSGATNQVSPPPYATSAPLGASTSSSAPAPVSSAYLGSFSTLHRTQDRTVINHYTVQPIIDVQCAADGRDLGGVAADVQREVAQISRNLPAGMRIRVRGQSESMTESFRSLGIGLLLAVVLVYLLMVVLFQSWLDPFIIIFAVPGALVGILWMLVLTGTTLNVESLMGSIMAVGIAVSNSILVVNFANEIRVERPGLSPLGAALEAGRVRLRPVLMTALAMVLGMLPMALGLGEGGEQNAPLGRAVIGGLLVATVVTLFIVPTIYSLLRRSPPSAHALDEKFEREAGERSVTVAMDAESHGGGS